MKGAETMKKNNIYDENRIIMNKQTACFSAIIREREVTMKKHIGLYGVLLVALICISVVNVMSQTNNPKEKKQITSPALMINNESGEQKPLRLQKLSINAEVIGNFAVTTIDMTFYNDLDRILEGELVFPLGEGQTVSRFAMELWGTLREGVVVEKAQGRKVFEEIVRRRIDPALLEMTVGNTFRSRVYPIPAKGTKRIVMAYEQELRRSDEGQVFTLPMDYSEPVDTFMLHAELKNSALAPDLRNNVFENIRFEKLNKNFVADFTATQFTANKPLTILMPAGIEQKMRVFVGRRNFGSDMYFYITGLPKAQKKLKKLPKNIVLLWDNSGSSAQADKEKVLDVVQDYIRLCGNCTVRLIEFALKPSEVGMFDIRNGNSTVLRKSVEALIPDGATRLHTLNLNNYYGDEIIVVTDGVQTFGKGDIITGKIPVTIINSAQTAEHGYLRKTALSTGGQYINCAGKNTDEIVQQMTELPLQFIGAKTTSGAEMYPSVAQPINGDFSLAGVCKSNSCSITLLFGFGKEIASEQTINIMPDSAVQSDVTPRLWAQKKLNELDMEFEKNKKAITDLGKEFSIVTKTTSLIVLELISDYVKYRIVPPTDELKAQYNRLVQQEESYKKVQNDNRLEVVATMVNREKGWYDDFNKQNESEKAARHTVYLMARRSDSLHIRRMDSLYRRRMDSLYIRRVDSLQSIPSSKHGAIVGRVVDSLGKPLAGATLRLIGTKRGANTKSDGSFWVPKVERAVYTMQVSFVGYVTASKEVRVDTGVITKVDFIMKLKKSPDVNVLIRERNDEDNKRIKTETVEFAEPLSRGVQADGGGFIIRGGRSESTQIRVDGLDIGDQFVGGYPPPTIREGALTSAQIANGAINQDKIVNTDDEFKRLNFPSDNSTALHWDGTEITMRADTIVESQRKTGIEYNGKLTRPLGTIVESQQSEVNADKELQYPIDGDSTSQSGRGFFTPTPPAGGDLSNGYPNPITTDRAAQSNSASVPSVTKVVKKHPTYIDTLQLAKNKDLYPTYLRLRRLNSMNAAFYAEAADIFMEKGQKENALRIISNLAELKIENQRLLRILGRRLLRYGMYDEAVFIFKEVRAIREEEPQSMRDLGLALAEAGKYQEAVDTLYAMALRTWDSRFPEVENIALNEMNNVIAKAGNKVKTDAIDTRLLYKQPLDLRIVLDWDADNCDIDLWVIDPKGEKCWYSNQKTKIGGKLSRDLTGGYGPEEFTLKNAVPGTYSIKVHYYGDRQQSIAGPTTINVQIFTDYGKPTEKKKDISMRMKSTQEVVEVGEIKIAKK